MTDFEMAVRLKRMIEKVAASDAQWLLDPEHLEAIVAGVRAKAPPPESGHVLLGEDDMISLQRGEGADAVVESVGPSRIKTGCRFNCRGFWYTATSDAEFVEVVGVWRVKVGDSDEAVGALGVSESVLAGRGEHLNRTALSGQPEGQPEIIGSDVRVWDKGGKLHNTIAQIVGGPFSYEGYPLYRIAFPGIQKMYPALATALFLPDAPDAPWVPDRRLSQVSLEGVDTYPADHPRMPVPLKGEIQPSFARYMVVVSDDGQADLWELLDQEPSNPEEGRHEYWAETEADVLSLCGRVGDVFARLDRDMPDVEVWDLAGLKTQVWNGHPEDLAVAGRGALDK